ncbi:transketolase [Paraglaciecola hydrolytica]|uniref:Transketolase n=2 Tax=Paraglaciecola hydrolytica TaxID=1799789 RepID=A0A148KKF6_9ALTE|nr:transketolase [Paraglaciecola hydrolytica]
MLTNMQLTRKSLEYRRDTLRWIKHAGAGHTGGSLSCLDILNVLYNRILRVSPQTFTSSTRDRYVQSKGHSVEALFVVLAEQGYFHESELETLCQYQSHFVGHPTRKIPGVEQNTGALGHGLPICTGMAIGAKMDNADFRVFTLLGDGEIAEGSNWEAAMAASHYKLDNLTAIVDCNTLQISGRTSDVMNNEPLAEKFEAFGWAVKTVDGHDLTALTEALEKPLVLGKPSAIIARTTKGKGVSFMEDVGKWHHGVPNDDEYARALAEINTALAALKEDSL